MQQELLNKGYRYALALLRDRSGAQDLVHDAWIRLQGAGAEIGKPQLFVTIRNLFIDQYRRTRLLVFEPWDDETSLTSADSVNIDITSTQLEAALGMLRAEEREALFLSVVEGYSAQEISALMQCPRNTVLSLVHRSKNKLRGILTARGLGRARHILHAKPA
jgi:RNA polymerase sigma-70 factor (ECF subfamily)